MPRVKHIMSGRDVISAWMRQQQDYARTPSCSVAFCGTRIACNIIDCTKGISRDACMAEVMVMPNGETVYFLYDNIFYRSYSQNGYNMRKMLYEFTDGKPNATVFECIGHHSEKLFGRMCSWGRWISNFNTMNNICTAFREFAFAKKNINRWGVDAPQASTAAWAKRYEVLFSEKVIFENVIKILFDESFELRKKDYDQKNGNGEFITSVRNLFNSTCKEYGVQTSNYVPLNNDGAVIRLSAIPRVCR